MTSFDEISQMFDTESKKLYTLINNATKINLSINEIIETYYQIINVSSMITMLKDKTHSGNTSLLDKIHETEKLISEKFNSDIHPKIMNYLKTCIQKNTRSLQLGNREKSKEETESEAKLFEELRQKMSTKEFVEQYDQGLLND
ncbi:hypothetical protein [Nitrosopumilus sp.]|uniref:hypothetical protein n=1 Tax=Nitrosopumilus sp. TaxID=2024843 RepID=UPI00247BD42E|nr:hypothetical protein [Nitrosopumilus sp.]MCV0411058.1 hypothetical protein [Nitrosopumilus sp.]